MAYDFDLVVIGGGPAGECGALAAGRCGKRVLLVERAPMPGGAAVHTGTLPSKTLRETALFLSGREHHEVYGVGVTVDRELFVPKLLSRKDAVRNLEVARIRKALSEASVELVRGVAKVSGAHQVEIAAESGTRFVSAEFILVATGSVPHRPDDIPWEDPHVEDSDTILELDSMPSSLVVLGAGVIGCEYASIFAALGVQVTLVDKRDEILPFLDAEVSRALAVAFAHAGIDVRLSCGTESIARDGEALAVSLTSGSVLRCDRLLFCGGRSGRTEGLGLPQVGVKLGVRGSVAVDERFCSSVPSILAAGDVIGFPALASTSMEQGERAVQMAFGLPCNHVARRAAMDRLPFGIYTIPEVSCVGLSEEDAIKNGIDVVVGRATFEHNARAKINGYAEGLVKLVFERKSRVLIGAHWLGESATELIHVGQMALAHGATVDSLASMVFNYPTLSECIKHAARDAESRWF